MKPIPPQRPPALANLIARMIKPGYIAAPETLHHAAIVHRVLQAAPIARVLPGAFSVTPK